jgi:ribA/ribD-fused uncharacterized protein
MSAPQIPQDRDWPGTGTGAKSDAYASKIFDRHVKQFDVVVSQENLESFELAEGGICVFEKFEGQRLVLFQGSWISNFQPAVFEDSNSVRYNCTEQAFQAIKTLFVVKEAKLKGLDEIAASASALYQKIMKSTNALYQKLSASQKFLYMDKEMLDAWMLISGEVMVQLNRLKFGQNQHLRDRLLALKGSRILEAIPDDRLWGIGMSAATAINGPPADLDPASPDLARLKDWRGLASMTRDEIDAAAFAGQNRQGRIVQHVLHELLAGREAPLEGSTAAARELVADLFRRTRPAEDEGGPEKRALYARLARFAEGPAPDLDAVLGKFRRSGGPSTRKAETETPFTQHISSAQPHGTDNVVFMRYILDADTRAGGAPVALVSPGNTSPGDDVMRMICDALALALRIEHGPTTPVSAGADHAARIDAALDAVRAVAGPTGPQGSLSEPA